MPRNRIPVTMGWINVKNWSEIMDIERATYPIPWTDAEWKSILSTPGCRGRTMERQGPLGPTVVGFLVYRELSDEIVIDNIAVLPSVRRQRVGEQAMSFLKARLTRSNCDRISFEVRETSLGCQLFFRSQGFAATGVIRGHYDDTGEDGYHFELERACCETEWVRC